MAAFDFQVRVGAENMIFEDVVHLIHQTYWAKDRPKETIRRTLEHSLCFGVFCGENQIGFCRIVTDWSTLYYVADVIVDEKYRHKGAAKKMMEAVVSHPALASLRGMLITRDAQKLYEQVGFEIYPVHFMERVGKK